MKVIRRWAMQDSNLHLGIKSASKRSRWKSLKNRYA
jgi:hypothetical protein